MLSNVNNYIFLCGNVHMWKQKMYCFVCRKMNKCILLIISLLSLSLSLSLSNGGDIRKEGGRIVVGWRFESNTRAKLIHSLKDGRKERQIVKKNIIVYLERIWLYIYRTLCEKNPKFIDFWPNIKKTIISSNNFHKIS